jgi:hypothetical protein
MIHHRLQSCLLGLALSCAPLLPGLQPPQASAQSAPLFFCGKENGTPTTMVRTPTGDRSFIRWTSSHFSSSGWSAEQRCKVVSERLQTSHSRGNLKFITTGRMNDQPVICSANSDGGRCLDLLYTLKPGQDPVQALRALLSARKGTGGPISETSSRVYMNIADLLNDSSVAPN